MRAIIYFVFAAAILYTLLRFFYFLILNRKIKKAKERSIALKTIKKGVDVIDKIYNTPEGKMKPVKFNAVGKRKVVKNQKHYRKYLRSNPNQNRFK